MKSHEKPAKCYVTRSVARNIFREKYGNRHMGQAWRQARINEIGELQYALELLRTCPKRKQYISF